MQALDGHIHLFKKAYGDLFANGHIRSAGELALFGELRRAHDIGRAFVIGYEGAGYAGNNGYILRLSQLHPWILPFAWLRAHPRGLEGRARAARRRGFFGCSLYLDAADDGAWLASGAAAPFWEWVEHYRFPVSLNMSWRQAPALARALASTPDCPVLVSHMGRPFLERGRLASAYIRGMSALASIPGVRVKLSASYAFAREGWRYPQRDLFPALDFLRRKFGARRLIFGSDFAPVLEHNTYRQALELVRSEYRGFSASELADIYRGNAERIILKTAVENEPTKKQGTVPSPRGDCPLR